MHGASAATSWKWVMLVLCCRVVAMGNECECRVVAMGNECECRAVAMGNECEYCAVLWQWVMHVNAVLCCGNGSNSPGSVQEIYLKEWCLEVSLVQGLGGGTQSPTINIPPGEASVRLLIRVLAVTRRKKQAEVNKTTPLNEVSDLNKEKSKRSCIPSSKSKDNSQQL
ncbi:hypothetical protein AVEN_121561-1 [Araneus ventricosus]|uniref:Secreted protein n=1 Tax=Araneus ventricosus TaxID=182803 RepID=A0A4Y2GRB5_ARAVE|nr:hypothetical protein AVEN_121561-1 [Araneus ventricosus]